MKKLSLLSIMWIMILFTGCQSGPSIEKGEKLLGDKKYDKAIEVFEQVIEEQDSNYDAWFGLLEALTKNDDYSEATDVIEELFKVIDKNYDTKSDTVDYEDVMDTFGEYAVEILEEEDSLGKWYEDLQPEAVDVADYDFTTMKVGEKIILDIPTDMEAYYNLDNKEVSREDMKYTDGILLTEEGELNLSIAVFNKYGMRSLESYALIDVALPPSMPVADVSSGTYAAPLTVYFGEFDDNQYAIYYTTDGGDPVTEGWYYYPTEGFFLSAGEYKVKATIFDFETYLYSDILTLDYIVEAAAPPIVIQPSGTYSAPLTLTFEKLNDDQEIYYTTDGKDPEFWGVQYLSEYGIELLEPGNYTLKAVIYDFVKWEYSQVLNVEYVIN